MGWLWPFSSDKPDATPTSDIPRSNAANAPSPETPGVALTDEQRMRIFGKPGPAAARDHTREEQADSELDAFIKSFQEDSANLQQRKSDASIPSNAKNAVEEDAVYSRILPDGSLDISPEAIYPRAMSCRQQFDQAFYCQSLGGKFNDIYRYGHLQSCSEQWGAFWFCMRTRTLPQREKEARIFEYYKTRDAQRKEKLGSSEDVWEVRKVAVQKAFWKDPDTDTEGPVQVQE